MESVKMLNLNAAMGLKKKTLLSPRASMNLELNLLLQDFVFVPEAARRHLIFFLPFLGTSA